MVCLCGYLFVSKRSRKSRPAMCNHTERKNVLGKKMYQTCSRKSLAYDTNVRYPYSIPILAFEKGRNCCKKLTCPHSLVLFVLFMLCAVKLRCVNPVFLQNAWSVIISLFVFNVCLIVVFRVFSLNF